MTEVERAILDLAVEDAVGAWEFLWRCRDVFPDVEDARFKDAIGDLLQRGALTALLVDDVEKELGVQQAIGELQGSEWWVAPLPGQPQLRLVASDSGAAEYYSHDAP